MIISAVIPAAGCSDRFGEDKLARSLGGRPVLVRAVEALSRRDEIREIIVAGPPGRMDEFRERFGAVLGFLGATVIEGGAQARWESVRNGVQHVSDDCTHIAVHDAARPCPSDAMLDRLLLAAGEVGAVVPGLRITSTVKKVDDSKAQEIRDGDALADAILGSDCGPSVQVSPIKETVDRNGLVLVQTPQIFEASLLRAAFEQGDADGCTDEAALLERLGHEVHVVEGDPLNIKLTTPGDWPLAEAALARAGSGSGA
ncbi:MAG: 2-C-methyl-D-erythritol 4-phosphate cytidylyltransferase [Phycisphaerales bacterium]|nr:2-C-methyl-D-erythritol 4-phosphate cytidylyltransferase [Phycisphaerales bacterium]